MPRVLLAATVLVAQVVVATTVTTVAEQPEEQPDFCDHNTCGCSWAADKSAKATYAGLSISPDEPAHISPGACELYCCCQGSKGGQPPTITDAPGGTLAPQTGPCNTWQWYPGGGGKCWLGVQRTGEDIPYVPSTWAFGATGRLGPATTPWGGPFVIAFVLCAVAYLSVGAVLNARQTGAKGVAALPHRAQWLALAALAVDGVAFARGRVQGRRREEYNALGPSPGDAGPPSGREVAGCGKEHQRGGANKKKHRGGERGAKMAIGAPSSEPQPAVDGAAAVESVSTAAGSGGRWVHVPT